MRLVVIISEETGTILGGGEWAAYPESRRLRALSRF